MYQNYQFFVLLSFFPLQKSSSFQYWPKQRPKSNMNHCGWWKGWLKLLVAVYLPPSSVQYESWPWFEPVWGSRWCSRCSWSSTSPTTSGSAPSDPTTASEWPKKSLFHKVTAVVIKPAAFDWQSATPPALPQPPPRRPTLPKILQHLEWDHKFQSEFTYGAPFVQKLWSKFFL